MTKLTMPQTEIKIEAPVSEFLKHLESNNRILFSGAFGIGKTFFLKHFFDSTEMKDKYNVFHLSPVNYQIATNEDIFELIKYDILYHLLNFDWVKIENTKLPESLAIQSYLMENPINIISKILQCVPVVEKAGKAIECLSSIQKDYLEYKKNINNNEFNLIEEFFKEFEQKEGSIHEFDAISKFIYDSLANCNDGILLMH